MNENSLVASITILGFAIAYLSMRALGTFLPGLSTSYINKILTLSRSTKQLLKLALDFILLPVCLWLAVLFARMPVGPGMNAQLGRSALVQVLVGALLIVEQLS